MPYFYQVLSATTLSTSICMLIYVGYSTYYLLVVRTITSLKLLRKKKTVKDKKISTAIRKTKEIPYFDWKTINIIYPSYY